LNSESELGSAQTDLLAHGGHPRLQQVGGRDVVVVDELALAAASEDVGHSAPDGQLIEQDPAGRRAVTEAAYREPVIEAVRRGVAVVDVRLVAPRPQEIPKLHHVPADGIPTGQGRYDVIDADDRQDAFSSQPASGANTEPTAGTSPV
jgi:hypothetical protein